MADLLREESGISAAAKRVLVGGAANVTEEKFEQWFGSIDLAYLLKEKGVAGTVARLVNWIPADVRLVGLSFGAEYVMTRKDLDRGTKFLLASLLRAAPRALTLMLGEENPKVEDVQAKLEAENKVIHENADKSELWVGPKRTELIHKMSMHPPGKDDVVNKGNMLDILTQFDRNPICPDCFSKELEQGRIKIEIVPKGLRKGRGYGAVANFKVEDKRFYFEVIEMLAQLEVDKDLGLGHEGEASHILAAHTLGLDNDPVALEKMIPDARKDAEDMIKLAMLSREEIEGLKKPGESLLPLSARLYVRRLLAAYRVDHPITHTEVRLKDWKDGLLDRLPAGLKPKKKGWAGVRELLFNPWSFLILLLLFVIVLLLSLMGFEVLAWVYSGVDYVYESFKNSAVAITTLFQEHTSERLMTIQKGLVVTWVALVLLPIVLLINEKLEKHRSRIQTIRLVLSGVGFGTVLVGWGLGEFTHTGVAIMVIAIWFILLIVEFSNKYGVRFTPPFVSKSSERFVTWGWVVAVSLLLLGTLYFATVGVQDAKRVSALSSGVMASVQSSIAEAMDIKLPPSSSECDLGWKAVDESNAKLGIPMTHAEFCAFEVNKNFSLCTCL